MSDFGMFFVYTQETVLANRGRNDCNVSTHQVEPLLLQPVHDDLERLIRHFIELLSFALAVEGINPLLVFQA